MIHTDNILKKAGALEVTPNPQVSSGSLLKSVFREVQLTIPPSWTSWSSARMRMMLLGLGLGSAHLTQQVSSSVSSVRAAGCPPLSRAPVAPARLLRPAIRPPQHRASCNKHNNQRCWSEVSFPLQGEGVFENVRVCRLDSLSSRV